MLHVRKTKTERGNLKKSCLGACSVLSDQVVRRSEELMASPGFGQTGEGLLQLQDELTWTLEAQT